MSSGVNAFSPLLETVRVEPFDYAQDKLREAESRHERLVDQRPGLAGSSSGSLKTRAV